MHGSMTSGIAFMKGTVETLLTCCETVWTDGNIEDMDEARTGYLLEANSQLAAQGTRVLGVAFRVLSGLRRDLQPDEGEKHFTFLGMIGMMDPPRNEGGFRPWRPFRCCHLLGCLRPARHDYRRSSAHRTIYRDAHWNHDRCSDSYRTQLDHTSSKELQSRSEDVSVYARVTPEHKLRIVESLQRQGHIVAMTGDGVNDAPALKKADIGVAMGLSGTDVAKEASDMVLLDDNFATIVATVKEGRIIYDNIRKFIKYLLAANSGEICVMLVTPLLGMPLALLPLQILWMNLVTDGLPALSLGVEPPESDIMRRPPHPPNESIFARGLGRHVLWVGILMGCLSIAVGYWYWRSHETTWQTMLFTTLTLTQMAHVLAIRSERVSLFHIGLLSNKLLLAAVSLTVLLQLALIYVPAFQTLFHTVSLSLRSCHRNGRRGRALRRCRAGKMEVPPLR